jgi:hypothetical protein
MGHHMRKPLKLTGAAVTAILALGLGTAATAGTAHADGANSYLSWTNNGNDKGINGPCSPGSSWDAGLSTFNPNDHSERIWQGESSDDNGNTVTRTWIQNGVTEARAYALCGSSTNYDRTHYSPTRYQHRHYNQVWNCNGGGCSFLFDNYTGWADGTEFP